MNLTKNLLNASTATKIQNPSNMKKNYLTLIAAAMFAATLGNAFAQTIPGEIAEAPPTIRVRVENLQVRHDKALAELQALFDRIARDPALISSKESVDAIDEGDRTLKNTKVAIASTIAVLKSEAKTISGESSFTDEQKTELVAAVDAMTTKCNELTARTSVAITHLEGAYKEMAKWRKIHKTYNNLDGEAKALEQLKSSVDAFSKGLTAEPSAFESAPTENTVEEKPE